MHVTVCMALLVCVLCQPVHSCIEPSLHGLDLNLNFFLEMYCLLYNGSRCVYVLAAAAAAYDVLLIITVSAYVFCT